MGKILITGASGFVGHALVSRLIRDGAEVICAARSASGGQSDGAARVQRVHFELDTRGPFDARLFDGVATVVHLAAHVHVPVLRRRDAATFERLNGVATQRLAEAAARAGVRRFIYLSSIGVLGAANRSAAGRPVPFTELDAPNPGNAYTRSKWLGEQGLMEICGRGQMQFVVIRAPLIFGPRVRSNFLTLMSALAARLPLPLRSCDAPRSLVYVDNVAALIARCVEAEAATNRVWLAADFDVAVAELARRLAGALDVHCRLFHCPRLVLDGLGALPLLGARLHSLTQPLLVNGAALRRALSWHPPVDLDRALADTAAWYRQRQ